MKEIKRFMSYTSKNHKHRSIEIKDRLNSKFDPYGLEFISI